MKKILKNYGFLISMLIGIIGGCITGALWPVVKDATGKVIVDPGATVLEPLGTVFINLMFCIVVPMVFCSIASAIAEEHHGKLRAESDSVSTRLLFTFPLNSKRTG